MAKTERESIGVMVDLVVQSATVTTDAMADVIYLQTIIEVETGNLLSSQIVRETVDLTEVEWPQVEAFARAAVEAKEKGQKLDFTKEKLFKE